MAEVLESLRERGAQRPRPRLGVTFAAAGMVLAASGLQLVGGNEAVPDDMSDGSRALAVAFSLITLVGGYVMVHRFRHGAFGAAGTVAAAFALPVLLFWLTTDLAEGNLEIDTILLVSSLGWTAMYAVGAAKGHSAFLFLALAGLWMWTIDQVDDSLMTDPTGFFMGEDASMKFESVGTEINGAGSDAYSDSFEDSYEPDPFGPDAYDPDTYDPDVFEPDPYDPSDPSFGGDPYWDDEFDEAPFASPDMSRIGMTSLVFAGLYLFAAARLSRLGLRGVATPFLAVGLVALVTGLGYVSEQLDVTAIGALFAAAGAGVVWFGAAFERRLTSWLGGAMFVGGITAVLGDNIDTPSAGGWASTVVGLTIVLAAHVLATRLEEPLETTAGPSFARAATPAVLVTVAASSSAPDGDAVADRAGVDVDVAGLPPYPGTAVDPDDVSVNPADVDRAPASSAEAGDGPASEAGEGDEPSSGDRDDDAPPGSS